MKLIFQLSFFPTHAITNIPLPVIDISRKHHHSLLPSFLRAPVLSTDSHEWYSSREFEISQVRKADLCPLARGFTLQSYALLGALVCVYRLHLIIGPKRTQKSLDFRQVTNY